MDWYPLWNSLRIAAISTVVIFFAGIFAAYYIAKLPRTVKGVLDVVLTLPMVLPPTVVGATPIKPSGASRVALPMLHAAVTASVLPSAHLPVLDVTRTV